MSVSHPHAAAVVAAHAAPLIGERAATCRRIATEGGDARRPYPSKLSERRDLVGRKKLGFVAVKKRFLLDRHWPATVQQLAESPDGPLRHLLVFCDLPYGPWGPLALHSSRSGKRHRRRPRMDVSGNRNRTTGIPDVARPRGDFGATVSVIALPTSGLGATFVVVREKRTGRAYLLPAAAAGCKHAIRIDSVHEVSCGLEARISGVLGDAAVTFFDPLYCMNRDRYCPGAVVDVELAGIAYSLSTVPHGTKLQTPVGDVPIGGAAVLLSTRKKGFEPTSRTVGDEQAFGVAYIEQPDTFPLPDDYQFCAPVKDVEESEIAAIAVWKFRSTVMRFYEGRQDVEIESMPRESACRTQ
jgi:hypothetical protein